MIIDGIECKVHRDSYGHFVYDTYLHPSWKEQWLERAGGPDAFAATCKAKWAVFQQLHHSNIPALSRATRSVAALTCIRGHPDGRTQTCRILRCHGPGPRIHDTRVSMFMYVLGSDWSFHHSENLHYQIFDDVFPNVCRPIKHLLEFRRQGPAAEIKQVGEYYLARVYEDLTREHEDPGRPSIGVDIACPSHPKALSLAIWEAAAYCLEWGNRPIPDEAAVIIQRRWRAHRAGEAQREAYYSPYTDLGNRRLQAIATRHCAG